MSLHDVQSNLLQHYSLHLENKKRNMPQYVVRFHTGLKQGRVGISLVKVDVTSVLALITIRVGRKQVQR